MKTALILAIASGAAMVGAQSPTSSASSATHTIKVGFPIGEHNFSPNQVNATKGDVIVFEMLPANHSVVHMDPNSPCIPWETAGRPKKYKWWSGFYPVQNAANPRYFNHTVDTEDPVWFYCSAPQSCQKYHMVGVINPKSPDDIKSVQQKAGNADFALSPGEPIPDEGGNPTSSSSSTASAASAPATASATDKDADSSSSGGSSSGGGGSSLSSGAIAGIVIGSIGAFALVGLLFFVVGRKKKSAELRARNEQAAAESAAAGGPAMSEHPPMYQGADPQYSTVPHEPGVWSSDGAALKPGHESMMSDLVTNPESERHPHRLSELPSQNYDPVEMYTPGLPEHPEGLSPLPSGADDDVGDRRRDTFS